MTSRFRAALTLATALVCWACSRPPSYIRVAGGNDSDRQWQLGEVRPCVKMKVTFNDGAPEELVLTCGTEEEIDNIIDLKETGLLRPVSQQQRARLHREPVLAVSTTHPEKSRLRCRKVTDGLTCAGEHPPGRAPNGLSLEERRLATWARNLPDESDPLLKNLNKLCKDSVRAELEIAVYNRTHPPSDQKAQVTDVRKELCGGPDGPGEKPESKRKTGSPEEKR